MQKNMSTRPLQGAKSILALQTLMASIATGDLLTGHVPGYRFRITNLWFVQNAAVTTGSKAATLTPYISSVALTGGVLALTSAACTPAGKVITDTPITAGNKGSDTDSITLTWSGVTTFIEGSGTVFLEIENLDSL